MTIDTASILARVAEIEARSEKATPGPWGVPDAGNLSGRVVVALGSARDGWDGMVATFDAGTYARSADEGVNNAAFASHARTDIPDMAGIIRSLVAEVERLTTAEAERWQAYTIAHDQALSNGAAAIAAEQRADAAEGLNAEAVKYAERLAVALHDRLYPEVTEWRAHSGHLMGLLLQIDNMTCRASVSDGDKE